MLVTRIVSWVAASLHQVERFVRLNALLRGGAVSEEAIPEVSVVSCLPLGQESAGVIEAPENAFL